MSKVHGKNFAVYVDGVIVGDCLDCTLNINQSLPDVTSKDDANWKKVIPGMRDWSVDTAYLFDENNALDGVDLIDLIIDATQVRVEFSQGSDATTYWYGNAYPSAESIVAPTDNGVSGNITFVGDGELGKVTISSS